MTTQRELRDFVSNHIVYNISLLMNEYVLSQEPELITEQFWENVREHKEEEMTGQVDEETEEPEIFEFWIVSDWLFERLKEKGEPVANINGVMVWGRTCTGQAIFLDGVIERIFNDWKDYIHRTTEQESQDAQELNEHFGATE
jgi:hypothetical protein